MPGNTTGTLFTVTSFGESHGPAIGCVVDGCPPGMELSEVDLQGDLERRRPGKTRHTTQRREADQVKILSGVFEGKTTGTPIALLIDNTDQRSKDYSAHAVRKPKPSGRAQFNLLLITQTPMVQRGSNLPRTGMLSTVRPSAS